MERREFVKTCGLSAASIPGLSTLLNSCSSDISYSQTESQGNKLMVDKDSFLIKTKDKTIKNKFIFIAHPETRYPICVYEVSSDNYVACLMSCTHQKCQTTVSNDGYICPCHGARFTNTGKVIKGPAQHDLLTYPIFKNGNKLVIDISA